MTYVDELCALDVKQLITRLGERLPEPEDLTPGEWLLVIAVHTSQISGVNKLPVKENWQVLDKSYSAVLASAVEAGAIDRHEQILRQINFSVALIFIVGASSKFDALNPVLIASAVLQEIPMSLTRARRLAKNWRELEPDQIQELQYIKNLVRPLDLLVERGNDLGPDPAIKQWIELRPDLP